MCKEFNYQLQAAEEELEMVNEDLNEEMERKAELARQRRELEKKQLYIPIGIFRPGTRRYVVREYDPLA